MFSFDLVLPHRQRERLLRPAMTRLRCLFFSEPNARASTEAQLYLAVRPDALFNLNSFRNSGDTRSVNVSEFNLKKPLR